MINNIFSYTSRGIVLHYMERAPNVFCQPTETLHMYGGYTLLRTISTLLVCISCVCDVIELYGGLVPLTAFSRINISHTGRSIFHRLFQIPLSIEKIQA